MSRPTAEEAAKRTELVSASSAACGACPWRRTNHGQPHPDGWYTLKNRRRLWAGLRRGERMTCHPTDPANPVPDGRRPAPEGVATRECAGALVLIQRELQRVDDAFRDGGWPAYRAANPRGLTREGAAEHLTALMFGGVPLVGSGPEVSCVDLNDAAVSHPDLAPWEQR